MKKCFKKFAGLAILFVQIMGTASCDGDDTDVKVIDDGSSIMDIGGGGNFLIVNKSTSDTLDISRGLLIGTTPKLQAKNGDRISISFLPAEKYQKFQFTTTYRLQDGTEVKNQYVHEYILENAKVGKDTISMSALYKDEIYHIGAVGTAVLAVSE